MAQYRLGMTSNEPPDHQISARARASMDTRPLVPVFGTDVSGALSVHLDASGRPERIDVAPQWRAHLRPEALSGACTEALLNALDARVELVESSGPAPQATVTPVADPRPLSQLQDALNIDFDALQQQLEAAFAPPAEAPEAVGGSVVIVLSGGAWHATVDPEWAAPQNSTKLAAGLNDALSAALGQQSSGGWELFRQLMAEQDQIFAEALGHLQRFANQTPGEPD